MKIKTTHTPGPWAMMTAHNGEDVVIVSIRPKSGNPQYIGRVYNSGILAKADDDNAHIVARAVILKAEGGK